MSNYSPSSGVQIAYTSVLAPAGGRGAGAGDGRHVSYRVVVIVVILSLVFILSGFLHSLARCLGRRRRLLTDPRQHNPLVSPLHGQLQHLFHLHDAGLEQAFINTLPVFAYGSIRGLKDSADCAVCLNEFADDDRLRLLPKCKHAFHLECINTWLLSHSTCPLCRRSLLPDHPLAHGGTSSSSHCRHDDPPSAEMATETATSTSVADMINSNRLTCPEDHPQLAGSRSCISTSLHSSCHNSFRMCDAILLSDRDSEIEIQEIEEPPEVEMTLHSTPSPVAPTIRVVDEHGAKRVLKVELGKVAACRVMPQSDPRKLTKKGARSYSMGSYEYIVDPTSWEVTIAPTPYPGRLQDWVSSKPSHRCALSDSIPELASAPANNDFFWASRGLYTPHSLSRVRGLLTPIMSSDQSSPFLEHSSSSLEQGGDRWIDIDIE